MSTASAQNDSNAERRTTSRELPSGFITPIAFGTVLQPLNSSMIAVALVGIRGAFDAGTSVTWLVSALYLATAVASPAMGRIADVFGARRASLAGFALVGLASVAAPFAPNIPLLVVCRVLIGIGTAAQYPCGVAMVRRAADELRARSGNALATLTVCSQVTVALGPTLGGLLVGALGWPGVFWINVPMVLIGIAVMLRWGPADPPLERTGRLGALLRIDPVGMLLFTVALTALMFWLLSLAEVVRWWWLVVAVPAGVATAWWSLRRQEPFLDMRLLGQRALSLTYLRTIVTYTAFYCVFYGIPQWLEEARELGPMGAGLVMLPIPAVGVLSTILSTRLQRTRGPWTSLVIGSAALCAGGLLLLVPDVRSPIPLLLAIAAMLGLPNGFNNMGNQRAMYALAPSEHMGAASGLYRTSQYVGANLAAAVLVLTLGVTPTDAGLHRMGATITAIALFLLVTALIGASRARRS